MQLKMKVLLAAAICWTGSFALATPVTLPAGLQAGDQYRLVFVTSTEHDAISANIVDYNSLVSAVAAAVPELNALGTTWRAIGSTESTNARDNTGTNPFVSAGVPLYRLDGTKIADDNSDLWDANGIDANISTNELGAIEAKEVWSGTNLDGTTDFISPLGGAISIFGTTNSSPEFWLYAGGASSTDTLHAFYAMSDVLTAVPEPSAVALFALGLMGLAAGFLRRGKSSVI